MGRKKEKSFKFSVEFGERDAALLERLADDHGVTKREILRQGLVLMAEIARLKQAGEKLLVENNQERRELMLLFAL